MKLVSFVHAGLAGYGAVIGDKVADLSARVRERYPTLLTALECGAVGELERVAGKAEPDHDLSSLTLLPPIPNPGKIICVGRNFKAHLAEANMPVPDHPNLFIRFQDTLVPDGAALLRPRASNQFDFEGELAVVIGKSGRHVAPCDATSHIAGYSCFNDATLRDFQFKHSLTAGKNFYSTAGFGPWLLTSSAVPDYSELTLTTRLNGQLVQHAAMDDLIFDIPFLISYISRFTPLHPGDVIATGTPEGVGFARTPPLWLKPGDHVEVEVSKIGTLRNTVIAEV